MSPTVMQPDLAQHRVLLPTEAKNLQDNLVRPACTECQRRKQKCNREWPCNNCSKRKVREQCQFKEDVVANPNASWTSSSDVKKKRERALDEDVDGDVEDALRGIEAIGYTSSHIFNGLDKAKEPSNTPEQREHKVKVEDSPALKRALDVLPPRRYVDALIQNFLTTVNFYYYIVYPESFLREYNAWWKDHDANRPVGLEWTCLLIMVCACSVQHIDAELGHRLTEELHSTPKELTDKYHDAARELHSKLPVGRPHIYTVQALLHSCYWFKAEARFEQCWHILGAAVREGQMLGLHQDKSSRTLSDFDREMWRRLWCLLDAWDWLVSTLLARPMLIDRSDCDARLPSLTLEPYPTSPLLHMKLQSELVRMVHARFRQPKNVVTPKDVMDYKNIMESWMGTFPPAYHFEDPDTSAEHQYPWIALHRHYLHTIALSMALGPTRMYMAKNMTKDSDEGERELRAEGVNYSLRLMDAVHSFFEYVWTRDTTFHFVPFCIFDTAALMCSAILHDQDDSLPRRQDLFAALDLSLHTLKRLSSATSTAKTPQEILLRLVKRIPNAELKLTNLKLEEETSKRIKTARTAKMKKESGPSSTSISKQSTSDIPASSSTSAYASSATGSASSATSPMTQSSSNMSVAATSVPVSSGAANRTAMPFTTAPSSTTVSTSMGNGRREQKQQQQQQIVSPHPQAQQHIPQYSTRDSQNYLPAVAATAGMSAGLHQPMPAPPQLVPMTSDTEYSQYAVSDGYGQGVSGEEVYGPPQLTGQIGFEDISYADMGDLAHMWNWQSLDLQFDSNPML